MSKLWLTYAWSDNEDGSVDHLYHRLRKHGVEVRMDRTDIWAGDYIWEQIDAAIRSKEIDGWGFYVTEASLRSGPCREELQYALGRALKANGSFPLIGILPHPVDDAILPRALSTRLYVRTNTLDWEAQIADRLSGTRSGGAIPEPSPVGFACHEHDGLKFVEVWPRTGTWSPTSAMAPADQNCQVIALYRLPRGRPASNFASNGSGEYRRDNYLGCYIQEPVDAVFSAFVIVSEFSGHIIVAGGDGYQWTLNLGVSA